ncbi:hypothetical protein VP01_3550g2 [Puccinia sorghi]|uniref:Uncharacterized protein n=1 Tax=Puccinia sorghi TaxID=27349 RepID=A0A0L6UXC1_9BASI|nr:hypothetical protein VP01_3550g2 [Puccinia sorghi]
MSVHLADCLDKFGPSRGQLKISFLVNFCCVGNFQALITQSDKFPPKLHPFLCHLQAFNDPILQKSPLTPKGQQDFFDKTTLNLLIIQLNELFPQPYGAQWISADGWSLKNLKRYC